MASVQHSKTEDGGYFLRFDGQTTFWVTAVLLRFLSPDDVEIHCAERLDNLVRKHAISESDALVGMTHIMNYVHGRDAQADVDEDPGPEVVG